MATPGRFYPVRAGIVNLYEYDDQVFELASGRLLLRGHNTSGKTKALELLLPFCLDGDISPRKLDPFAKSAKEMKWNLVGCIEGDQRIGYAWLEFGRLTEHGMEYVTAAVGMKANRADKGVKRWFLVAPGRRVGHDLSLRHGRAPLTRRELAEQLEGELELLDTPTAYREALNRQVFGFPSLDQYRTMLTLMLELRRPHLSKGLEPGQVTELLSAALPEVDHDLMRRLGDGLEQLEEMQRSLERLRAAHRRLLAFHESAYRSYARAALADRAAALRAAETGYESASRERRERERALAEARAAAARLADELLTARGERDRLDGELRALLGSGEWASVAELESLGALAAKAERAARNAAERAEERAAEAAALEADAIAGAAALEAADSGRAEALAELGAEAGRAGLARRHATLADQLVEAGADAGRWRSLYRDELERWQGELAVLRGLLDTVRTATIEHEQRVALEEAAELRRREAAETLGGHEGELAERQERLVEAIERWARELRELPLSGDELATAIERALVTGRPGAAPPHDVWAAAARERLGALLDERSALSARARAIDEARDAVEAERAALEREEDDAPPPPPLGRSERDGRPGAPLWRLVDFAPGLAAAERAGLEAALQAAGLLDAWVTPEGAVLDGDTRDVLLRAGDARPARSLAAVLVPVAGGAVAPGTVRSLLESVALGESGETSWAGTDGRFRLGVVHGRAGKAAAEYVGAAARAERRERRLRELASELARIDGERGAVDEEQRRTSARLQALAAEQEHFPSLQPVAEAMRAVLLAAEADRRLRAELEECRSLTVAAARQREASAAAAAERAEALDLPRDTDAAGLGRRRDAALRCEGLADRASAAHVHAAVQRERLDVTQERHRGAAETASELAHAAEEERAEARRRVAEHAERERALGSTGAELRQRKGEVERDLEAARLGLERLLEADKAASVAVARTEGDEAASAAALVEAERRRASALAALARLELSDFFVLALGDEAPHDHADAASWSLTRALDVLRAIPPERLKGVSSLAQLASPVQRRVSELDRELAQHAEMSVFLEHDADGLIVVKVMDGPVERTLPDLLAALGAEIAERERTLTAEQRRVFGDALLEEIAEHLRARMLRVGELVDDMNATLERCTTAAGKRIALEWRPRDDGDADLPLITRLLRRSLVTLPEEDRGRLIDFFRASIERARELEGADGQPETLVATLRSAFDYRRWFAFSLIEVQAGERRRLTARRHAVGSGGEQAVLVHLPLFASAAALYGSSRDEQAPRLVMLDEALSGIDDDTRERVMGALVELDLDFVMTSHELWGTYRTVPELAIYQLHRENGEFGVACERFHWDGELLREGEQADLLR